MYHPFRVVRPYSQTAARYLPRRGSHNINLRTSAAISTDVITLSTGPLAISRPPRPKTVPPHLQFLRDAISASFLPKHQDFSSPGPVALDGVPVTPEPGQAVAVATAFDGGDGYIREAVETIAGSLDAEVLRLNLGLLLRAGEAISVSSQRDDIADLTVPGAPVITSRPLAAKPSIALSVTGIKSAFSQMPMMVMGPGLGDRLQATVDWKVNHGWVSYFEHFINSQSIGKKRVILIEGAAALSHSFPQWWTSFVVAVKRRRRGLYRGSTSQEPRLDSPTAIVLSCAPSPEASGKWKAMSREDQNMEREAANEARLKTLARMCSEALPV